ncbi:D-alanyl-D-alanine carboxypeptidase family protein [Desulfotomaculum copahuensis]|uniref:serine-type D-Ala-D-Ala carboxypeptidase n=1 Tax=Desulfotomaculum copahuensis TaxID=1838280 RepID=A0A1B7LHX0_9FIRM|nr:D-alanyl-D-alanine carboxypeptidase family protein [Desulfotomaculum copahuensis]OAT85885.1 D-alanyl-D-alanine carboxypeptidase [Desulfotomaculum copahuensis]
MRRFLIRLRLLALVPGLLSFASILMLCLYLPAIAAAGQKQPHKPEPVYPALLNLGEMPAGTPPVNTAPSISTGADGKNARSIAAAPSVTAAAAVLMDAATGQVLWAKNARQPRPPASTTKIMTALLALEGGKLDRVVTVGPHAASVGESSMHLFAGEKLTLEQLLYGALLRSGNDACVAIAEHIAGSEGNFVLLMNQKARELGALNTHFCNPNGLPAQGHLSSAYDLALLTRYAFQNPAFNRIVSTRTKDLGGRYYFNNTNHLLWSYQGADGVKTGTTNAAGKCLVASATREGRRLITVVLHSDDRYADTMDLLDYGFARFKNVKACRAGGILAQVPVSEGVMPEVPLVCDRELTVTVPADRPQVLTTRVRTLPALTAPVADGMPAGELTVLVDGQPVAGARLLTGQTVERLPAYQLWWGRLTAGREKSEC